MKATIVYIYWLDSAYQRECDDPATCAPVRLHTTGWLVREDEECVVLAMETDAKGGYRDFIAIPHICVMERREQGYEMAS